MSTSFPHNNQPTYEEINQKIEKILMENGQELWFNPDALKTAVSLPHLATLYSAVRPILMIIASLPLLAQQWREVLNAFVIAIDALIATVAPTPATQIPQQ